MTEPRHPGRLTGRKVGGIQDSTPVGSFYVYEGDGHDVLNPDTCQCGEPECRRTQGRRGRHGRSDAEAER